MCPSFTEQSFHRVVADDRAVTGSRNIRHSRNSPSIVCCTCCDCCGFFRGGRKVAFPRLLEVAPMKTDWCHLLISLLCDFVRQRRSVLAIALRSTTSHFLSDNVRGHTTRARTRGVVSERLIPGAF